jgi:hypothetical protein
MASLLVAASLLTYDKIKDKRAAKKDAKRKGYEARYTELEREHWRDQEKAVQAQQTGSSKGSDQLVPPVVAAGTSASQHQQTEVLAHVRAGRTSSECDRASSHSKDGPSSWVDDVLREREKRDDLARVNLTTR